MRPSEEDARYRIECFCARKPLIARGGIRQRGSRQVPFVWIKTIKNGQIQTEVVMVEGVIFVTCRECLRVHRITIKPGQGYKVDLVNPT